MATRLLNEDEVDEIMVELYAQERTFQQIAEEFRVSRETIGHINAGRVYKMEHYKYPIRLTGHKIAYERKQERKSGNTS